MMTPSTKSINNRFRLCIIGMLLLAGTTFPATASAQLVTVTNVTFSHSVFTRAPMDIEFISETSAVSGSDVTWSCTVKFVNSQIPNQTFPFKYRVNGAGWNNQLLTSGQPHTFNGSAPISHDHSSLEIIPLHGTTPRFTGTWLWDHSSPDPVTHNQLPPSPCTTCGGIGCGQLFKFQPVCPSNPLLTSLGNKDHWKLGSSSTSGCSSCSGSIPLFASDDNLLAISQKFIPNNQKSIGSSSPGVYYNFDQRIEFYPNVGGKNVAILFDPISERTFYCEYKSGQSGYVPQIEINGVDQDYDVYFDPIELQDANGNAVSDPTLIATQPVYAISKSREGWKYKSELVDIDPGSGVTPISRVVQITSPTGRIQNITYQFNYGDPGLAGAPKKILMLDELSDWQGNTASFSYSNSQQAGRWVVSDIAIVAHGPSGNVTRDLRYTYDSNGHLHQVFRTTGAQEVAVATYTYGIDSLWQAATIVMDEHFGDLPVKKTIYVSQDYRLWENELVNQYSNNLLGAADGAGVRNLIVFRDMNNPGNFRILENDRLTEWEAGVSVIACSSYTTGSGQGYSNFTNIQYESTYPQYMTLSNGPPTTAQVLLGRPEKVADGSIRSAVMPVYDANGNVERVNYGDNSYELYQYDACHRETYCRDREGIVTLTERNGNGQIIRIVRGLVDVSGPGSETTDSSTVPIQNVWGYDSNGLLEWEAITAYVAGAITPPAANVRTDYVYNANKQLIKVLEPLAPGQSARPETQYVWEGEQLASMTVIRDSSNETTSYEYDDNNRLVETTYPDSTTEQVGYTSNGLTVYRKDRSNIVDAMIRDSVGRLVVHQRTLAYDSDLTNVDINGAPSIIFERLSDQVSSTSNFFAPGERLLDSTITDGKTTEYVRDYKSRLTEKLRFIGHRGGVEQAQATRTEYKSNMRLSEESLFGTVSSGTFTPAYTRKTYFGYAADGTTVRTVQVASTSTTYSSNASVMNASRPSSTTANPTILISDAIRDLSGNVVSLINALNTTQLTSYDTLGRPLSQKPDSVNFSNLISTSEYDVWNNTTESTNPAGVEATRQYDASGQYQVSQVFGANTTSLSAKTEFTYDRSGRRKSVIAPGTNGLPDSSRTTSTFYDAACCGQTIGVRDSLGNGQIQSSDPSGRVIHTAQVEDYDTHTTLLNPTDAKTNGETTTRYLDDGKVQFRTLWTQALDENVNRNLPQLAGLGKPASWGVTTQYVYDSSVGDGVGLETTSGVSVVRIGTSQNVNVSIGAAITKLGESAANGGADLSLTTHKGSATLVISPDEKTMQCSIADASGRSVMSALLSGPAATTPNQLLDWSCIQHDLVYNLSGAGNVEQVKQIDSDGNVVSRLSDGYGWGIASLDQDSNLTQTEFNPGGQPLTVTNALSNDATFVYDSLGRQTSITTPAAITTAVYSATTGQLASQTDGKSKTTSFQYDALSRLSTSTDRLNKQSSRSYYRTGQLASVTDAESNTTSYDYDVLGHRTELRMPAIGGGTPQETTYAYDSAGRMETVTLHSGAKRVLNYEFSGVLDKVDYFAPSGSTPSGTDDFTYDAFLRRTGSTSSDNVTHTYTYTDRGQLDTDTTNYTSQDYVVDYDYDSLGRLNEIAYPSSREVDYTFTNRGELDIVKWNGNQIENRAYDALGRMTNVDRAHVDETRGYDNANRVTSIANTNLGTATYAYDANSNKLGETWTGVLSNWSFTTEDSGASSYPDGYDEEDRFRRFWQSGQTKDYDLVRSDIGSITDRKLNGTNQPRTFNEVHQLANLAGTAQTFDANGNLTISHTGMTLNWEEGNGRLDQTVVPSGAAVGIEGTNEYGYDAENRRLWKKITRSGSVSEHTVFIYAGPNCIAEYDAGSAAASPDQEYIYGQAIDSLLLIAHDNNTEQLNVLRNQQWSIAGLTKDSDGSIAELYSYDVFGKRTILAANGTTIRTTSSYNNPYGYTSRRHDDESGLMYYRARYYNQETSEFISQDPFEHSDGMSMYRGYFLLNGIDPSGLKILTHSSIDHFFASQGIKVTKTSSKPHTYTTGVVNRSGTIEQEIITAMLSEKHSFAIAGTCPEEIIINLKRHIESRKTIVRNAYGKVVPFRKPSWEWEARQVARGGRGSQEYWDAINRPEGGMMCKNCTDRIFDTGTKVDRRHQKGTRIKSVWIPGDAGYIFNDNFDEETWGAGYQGENVIYVGKGQFWGHINDKAANAARLGTSVRDAQTVQTGELWFRDINKYWRGNHRRIWDWPVLADPTIIFIWGPLPTYEDVADPGSARWNRWVDYSTVGLKW